MHTLSGQRSVEQLLEQARGEKDRHRMRTYLRLLEDYSVYMTPLRQAPGPELPL